MGMLVSLRRWPNFVWVCKEGRNVCSQLQFKPRISPGYFNECISCLLLYILFPVGHTLTGLMCIPPPLTSLMCIPPPLTSLTVLARRVPGGTIFQTVAAGGGGGTIQEGALFKRGLYYFNHPPSKANQIFSSFLTVPSILKSN